MNAKPAPSISSRVIKAATRGLLQGLFVALAIAAIYFTLSYYFFYPQPLIEVSKHEYSSGDLLAYRVMVSNPSGRDVYSVEFSVRFDAAYPIKHLSMDEINFKTGINLRTFEDFSLTEIVEDKVLISKRPRLLMSGFRGSTNQLVSGAKAAIEVIIDKSYKGEVGDVFPTTMIPTLRSSSYYMEYKYQPFGLFASIFIGKKGIYDFNNKRTAADYYKTYEQRVVLSDGRPIYVGLEVGKTGAPVVRQKIVK